MYFRVLTQTKVVRRMKEILLMALRRKSFEFIRYCVILPKVMYRRFAALWGQSLALGGMPDKNYQQLQGLHEKYAESQGLRILGFPCNQFGGQEPGSESEIKEFIKQYNVEFDMFSKINVNGDKTHPLWSYLKKQQGGTLGDFIKWNFSKFLIDKNGQPVKRYAPNVEPNVRKLFSLYFFVLIAMPVIYFFL
ncbi:Phospholipid hydroperoxide glutathione peroxidase [Araneus ventricosus]|uniref:Glutathione peroxidase n=1 Tax=Araneus ventricosus TaxID=182803 RepID=A0A4Y2MU09_ARAVE|nr:Phospholipid hydroperoxide glutathione peroxidase [Araneus ventricosus]